MQNFNNHFEDVDDKFSDFYFKLGVVLKDMPLTPKEVKLQNKLWISANLSKMIKIKNKLFQRKKRQPKK